MGCDLLVFSLIGCLVRLLYIISHCTFLSKSVTGRLLIVCLLMTLNAMSCLTIWQQNIFLETEHALREISTQYGNRKKDSEWQCYKYGSYLYTMFHSVQKRVRNNIMTLAKKKTTCCVQPIENDGNVPIARSDSA